MNLQPATGRRGGCAAELAERFDQHHAHLIAAVGDLSKVLDELVPRVVGQETIALDANGTATRQFRVPFRSVYVESQSAQVLTVAGMPMQTSPPGTGPGIAHVRPGGAAVANIRAYQWSIWGGTPGDLVTVTVFGHPQPPATTVPVPVGPQAASVTSVNAAIASTPLLAAAAAVNGRSVYNGGTATLYLSYGAAASAALYTVAIPAGSLYEFPQPVYAGPVSGAWAAAGGAALVTEW